MALTDKLTAIGDAIRAITGSTELIPLAEMPNEVYKVHEIGVAFGAENGYNNGYNDGYNDGKTEEYDRLWDSFQDKGARTYYVDAFNGSNGWDKYNLYPKYDITPVGNATKIFYAWEQAEKHIGFDLAQRLEECGVVLDTSQATNLVNAFAYSHFSRLPAIDARGITTTSSGQGLFANAWNDLKTIDKIIMDENTTPYSWFTNTTGLKNLTIEGTIGNNFAISACSLLTHDSLMSIINALKDFGTTETKTVTLGATNLAKLTDEEKAIATQKGWTLA